MTCLQDTPAFTYKVWATEIRTQIRRVWEFDDLAKAENKFKSVERSGRFECPGWMELRAALECV